MQDQGRPSQMNMQVQQQQLQQKIDQRQLFPHPPIQCFRAPEVPLRGSTSQKSQGKQPLSSQDVRRDP